MDCRSFIICYLLPGYYINECTINNTIIWIFIANCLIYWICWMFQHCWSYRLKNSRPIIEKNEWRTLLPSLNFSFITAHVLCMHMFGGGWYLLPHSCKCYNKFSRFYDGGYIFMHLKTPGRHLPHCWLKIDIVFHSYTIGFMNHSEQVSSKHMSF